MRYNRLRDIGLTEQQIKDNLLFTTDKVGDTMKVAIDPKQAKEWFGALPPDLTRDRRSRAAGQGSGADYLYTYLRTYYRDDTKATGWNNLAFPNVGMPHVLWELQGERKPVFEDGRPARPRVHVSSRAGSRQARHHEPPPSTTRPWATWWPTCSGWRAGAEHPRAPGRVGAAVPGCVHRDRLALNAAFWKDIKYLHRAVAAPGPPCSAVGASGAPTLFFF
jgi:ubiquinol-cytochrome c reductase cytochrome c1 subunit